jgi:RimJ/RimL family protein N-acetyltransferase
MISSGTYAWKVPLRLANSTFLLGSNPFGPATFPPGGEAKVKQAETAIPRLDMKLETERLELRSATPADASNLLSLFSSPEVLRYLPPIPPFTLEQATQAIARRMKMEAELGYAPLIILTRDGNRFIGSGGVVRVKDAPDVEIAYHFLPSAWGRGYATEAAAAILAFGFETLRLKEIIGLTFPDNVASWRVLEKVGMRYVGTATYYGIEGLKKYVASRVTWVLPKRDI